MIHVIDQSVGGRVSRESGQRWDERCLFLLEVVWFEESGWLNECVESWTVSELEERSCNQAL